MNSRQKNKLVVPAISLKGPAGKFTVSRTYVFVPGHCIRTLIDDGFLLDLLGRVLLCICVRNLVMTVAD